MLGLDAGAQTFNKNTSYSKVLNVYAGSFVGDINQDGYDDIICTDRRNVYILLNNGTDSIGFTKFDLGVEQSIDKVFKLWDIDGDGDLDILMGGSGRVVLIENQSTLDHPAFEMMAKDFLYFGSYTKNLVHFDIGDLNEDSYYDIVVAYGKTEVFFQRENETFFRFELVNAPFLNVRQVEIVDLNEDGRKDILVCGVDTTNQKGMLFLNNSNSNFSSSRLLSNTPVHKFFLESSDSNSHIDIHAVAQDSNDSLALITYNYVTSDDSLAFRVVKQSPLGTEIPILAFGSLNDNEDKDMIFALNRPFPIQIRYDFEQDTSISSAVLDSLGAIRAVFISDLDQDGDDDIIVFSDRNAFVIYEQIAKPVATDDVQYVVALSPNPTSDYLRVDAAFPVDKVYIHDVNGYNVGVYEGQQTTSMLLDIQRLKPGIYAVIPVIQGQAITGKLFVKM